MDHTPQSAYAHLRDTRPAWFSSPTGEGAVGIMRWPMTEGQVLHRDEERVVLEDPAVLPDGQHARRRALEWRASPPPRTRPDRMQDQLGTTASEVIGLGQGHPAPSILAEAVLLYAARIDAVGLVHGAGIREARTVAFAGAERMALTGQITDAVTITTLFRARQAGLCEERPAA